MITAVIPLSHESRIYNWPVAISSCDIDLLDNVHCLLLRFGDMGRSVGQFRHIGQHPDCHCSLHTTGWGWRIHCPYCLSRNRLADARAYLAIITQIVLGDIVFRFCRDGHPDEFRVLG